MSRPRIVIRAFQLRRDMSSTILLKLLLEKAGCEVFISHSGNYLGVLRRWRPQAVIVNTFSVVRATRSVCPNTAIMFWPGEGGETREGSDAWLLRDQREIYDQIDCILSWGRASERYFAEFFPKDRTDHRHISANPRLELAKFNPSLLQRNKGSRSVGIVGRFMNLNDPEGVPALRTLNIPENLWEIIYQAKAFTAVVKVIDAIVKNTDLQISIRPHPYEAPQGYRFLQATHGARISIDESYDFAAWAASQKAILSPSSNSFLEAYVLRIPVINIEALVGAEDAVKSERDGVLEFLAHMQDASYLPLDYDELVDMVTSELRPKGREKKIDDLLDDVHNWSADLSGSQMVVEKTLSAIAKRSTTFEFGWPRFVVELEDRVRFRRAKLRNSLVTNLSYQSFYHEIPSYYAEVVDNIVKGRRLAADLP